MPQVGQGGWDARGGGGGSAWAVEAIGCLGGVRWWGDGADGVASQGMGVRHQRWVRGAGDIAESTSAKPGASAVRRPHPLPRSLRG